MGLSDDLGTVSTWMERGVFVGALLVVVYLGATGPWQAGGAGGAGACPVTGDAAELSLADGRSVDDLGAVEVYVTTYPAHADGAECEHRSLEPGESATVEDTTVAVSQDGAVTVDGDSLGDGQTWSKRSQHVDPTDPWYTRSSTLRFLNAGTVRVDDGGQATDRTVRLVTGTGTDRASLSIVVAATFFSSLLVVIGIALEWSVRYSNVDLYREDATFDDDYREDAGDHRTGDPGGDDPPRGEPGSVDRQGE
ncbi:hypothetical protein BRD00_06180 [Halobacteriales archaeon QS_8_69_26]|nr:MAG: hypothetical protein BRD00_06180 [Halobacteriales archaeon QS_8_69_26]